MNSINSYRYEYQGEYAEDETEEDGIKANSFQLRLYNPRLSRWMSPDPNVLTHQKRFHHSGRLYITEGVISIKAKK